MVTDTPAQSIPGTILFDGHEAMKEQYESNE